MKKIQTVGELCAVAEANGAKLYIIDGRIGQWVGKTSRGLVVWQADAGAYAFARPYTGKGKLIETPLYNCHSTGYLEAMAYPS